MLLPWPLPALLAWMAGWLAWLLAQGVAAPPAVALALGCAAGITLAWRCPGRRRRMLAAAGFPLSALVLGALPALPPWVWCLALAPLLLLYPLRSWRDAPFFPTPAAALWQLPAAVGLPAPDRVLEAGCGLGHGLAALRRAWPQARLLGLELSPALAALAALRCPWARVRCTDMWAADWSGHDLVYLFQRPETMPRAAAKALAEMRPGSWLVSLEFPVPGWRPHARLDGCERRPVWVYRVGQDRDGAPGPRPARSTAARARR